MRPNVLHSLFPTVRAEVLRLLFTNPRQELYVRELAGLCFLNLHTVQDELAKLRAAGILVSRSNGYHRFYRANPRHGETKNWGRVFSRAAGRAGAGAAGLF